MKASGVIPVVPVGARVGVKIPPHYQKRVCEICGITSDQKHKVNISFLSEINRRVCLKCKAEILKLTEWNPFKGSAGDQTWWMPFSKNNVPDERLESCVDVAFAWATDRLSMADSLRQAFETVLMRHNGQTKPVTPVVRVNRAPMRAFSSSRRAARAKSMMQLELFL